MDHSNHHQGMLLQAGLDSPEADVGIEHVFPFLHREQHNPTFTNDHGKPSKFAPDGLPSYLEVPQAAIGN